MPNNIAVSITADVADLQVKRAVASAEVKAFQKDLDSLARSAKAGMTDQLRAQMLAAADGAAKARGQVALINRELENLAARDRIPLELLQAFASWSKGADQAKNAMGGLHVGTAGVTRELITMAREAGRGNFSRMAGSATILAQRLGLLTPEVAIGVAAIAALAAPLVAVAAAMEQGSEQVAKFKNAMEATNGYAGVTISQLQEMARATAAFANVGVGKASEELMKLSASGLLTGETLQLVGADALRMSELTGESADRWNAEFEKMGDGVAKFAQEYIQHYGQLTAHQLEYIQQLEQQGRKEEAEHELAKDIYEYLGTKAPENLGNLEKAWRDVGNAISGAWDQMKAWGRNSNADQIAQLEQHRKSYDPTTQGGRDEIAQIDAKIGALKMAEAIQEKIAGDTARTTAAQKDGAAAIATLKEQFDNSRSSGEKLKLAIAQINDELNKAVAADPANKALYEQEAAAARAQAEKSDAPKAKGPGVVQQWQDEFRQAQVLSNDFFGDETQKELQFWQSKVALTTRGSKEWLEVQGRIYDASKALARQSYQAKLADLNDQLEADRNSWAKEQSDWQAKLAYIKSSYGEQSSEYKNAQREQEAAERQHQAQMGQIQREGAQEALSELKSNLDAAKAVREANARVAEAGIQGGARYNPFAGEVRAAQQIAALHQQMNAQDLAEQQQLQAAKERILEDEIAATRTTYGEDSAQYAKAVDAKKLADLEWANQLKVLSAQGAAQQAADQQKVAQAWHAAIDPMVSSVGSQFKGLIEGTESWGQAVLRVGEDALGAVISGVEKMVEAWIVGELQRTAATAAGSAARTAAGAAEQAPFLARVAAELAHWLGLETAKTASTATGATARTAAEAAAMGASIAAAKAQAAAEIPAFTGIAAMGAAAAMASIPIAGPGLADAAAGDMVALGGSMMGLASFAVGTNVVPSDMIAQIHAGERIIPAADNRALMAAVGAGPGGGGRSGDVHQHITYAPQLAGPTKSFRQQLQDHASDVTAMLRTAVRNGALSF